MGFLFFFRYSAFIHNGMLKYCQIGEQRSELQKKESIDLLIEYYIDFCSNTKFISPFFFFF